MQAFRERDITFSGISYPSSLPDEYKSLYAEEEIQEFADAGEPGDKQVFVYFNNTWGISALTKRNNYSQLY